MKKDFFKKILYLTIIFSIFLNHVSGLIVWALENIGEEKQNITINNEELYSAIIKQLENLEDTIYFEKNDESKTIIISENELQKVQKLQLNNLNLSNIKGLEEFKYVEELNISNNNITSINPLSKLTSLKKLEAFGNSISDLSPISNIISLEYLNVANNNLKDTGNQNNNENSVISKLSKLTSLIYLDMSYNTIGSTQGLEELTNLKYLNLYDNKIHQLTGLDMLTNLKYLNLGENNRSYNNGNAEVENGIANLENLNTLINLEYLNFSDNYSPDILKNIGNLKKLEELNLESNNLNDLKTKESDISCLTYLKSLNLYNNNISDIRPLFSLNKLEEVILQKNKIEDLFGILDNNNEIILKNTKKIDIAFNNIDKNSNEIRVLCEKARNREIELNYEYITDTTNLLNNKNYVTYEEFGARCDRVFDDYIAIRNAHIFANNNNCEVRATSGKTYHIYKYYEDPVDIKTSVNWNNATFIIHDEEIEKSSGRYKSIFNVSNITEGIIISNDTIDENNIDRYKSLFNAGNMTSIMTISNINILDTNTINTNTKKLDLSIIENEFEELNKNGNKKYLCKVIDDDKKQYIRYSTVNADNGFSMQDSFIIDSKGNILDNIQWDFDNITAMAIYAIPDSYISLQNATFKSNSLNSKSEFAYRKNVDKGIFFERNINIESASNIAISNLKHTIENEIIYFNEDNNINLITDDYENEDDYESVDDYENNDDMSGSYIGFIHANNCVNVKILDCELHNGKYSKDGRATYDMKLDGIVNAYCYKITSKNIDDRNRWGAIATNNSKDIIFKDCVLNRIDAHRGIYNLTVEGCNIGIKGFQVVGQGILNILDTTVDSDIFIRLRSDYGSFWNGNINIIRCTYNCKGQGNYAKFIRAQASYDKVLKELEEDKLILHDFGYDCRLPNIYIEDLTVNLNKKFLGFLGFYTENQGPKQYTNLENTNIDFKWGDIKYPEEYWPDNIFINGYKINEFENDSEKIFKITQSRNKKYDNNGGNAKTNSVITDIKLILKNSDGTIKEDITQKCNYEDDYLTTENVYLEIKPNNSAKNIVSLSKDNNVIRLKDKNGEEKDTININEEIESDKPFIYEFKEEGTYKIKIQSTQQIIKGYTMSGETEYEFTIQNMALNKAEETVIKGQSKNLVALIRPELSGKEITWTSSNPEVADVDESGKVKAKTIGETTITASIERY